MIITILLILILIVLGYHYYTHYGRNGRLINCIPGPQGYPISGNILQYLGSRVEQWKILTVLLDQYYPIFKIWAFSLPIVIIRHPDDLKTILSNVKHADKSLLYNGLHPWIGTGSFAAKGAKWHLRRKMLTPAFHFNILQQFIPILIEEGENMAKALKNSTVVKDVIPFVNEHMLNAICETSMGISLRDQDAALQERYHKALYQIVELFIYRLLRQWLNNDWIFSLTSKGKEQAEVLKILHGFTDQIIAERKRYHKRTNGQFLKNLDSVTSTEANDAEITGTKKRRLALLDLLIAASREGLLTDLDIRDEVNIFLFGGHDTTALALSYLIILLAEHKDVQDCVRNEIDTVLEENKGKFTLQSLENLPYLDRCIKESLRLYPPGYQMSRVTGEDVKLQSYVVPAGTTVLVSVYGVHRDPNFWPNPEIFDPDRFSPEKMKNRHPYAYIPFSAGPRNCLGHRYALLQMKALIVPLLRNFYLEPIDYLKDLRIQVDLVLSPAHPVRVKFVPIY